MRKNQAELHREKTDEEALPVDDVKAVLRHYGIPRFTYHTWDAASEGVRQPGNVSGRRVGNVSTYFGGRADPGSVANPIPPPRSGEGRSILHKADHLGHDGGSGAEGGSGLPANDEPAALRPVPWEAPEDLAESLPLFLTMRIPERLVEDLSRRNWPTVETCGEEVNSLADLSEMETVPPSIADRGAGARRLEDQDPSRTTGHPDGGAEAAQSAGTGPTSPAPRETAEQSKSIDLRQFVLKGVRNG